MATVIQVQLEDFNCGDEIDRLEDNNHCDGALVTFTGRVRDNNQGLKVSHLFLEHYSGMTEKCLAEIAEQAKQRFTIANITIIHRFGELKLGEKIVFVGVTSKHRKEAFKAAEFIMDYLKVQAPFWKKEQTEQGAKWLDANQSDHNEASKW